MWPSGLQKRSGSVSSIRSVSGGLLALRPRSMKESGSTMKMLRTSALPDLAKRSGASRDRMDKERADTQPALRFFRLFSSRLFDFFRQETGRPLLSRVQSKICPLTRRSFPSEDRQIKKSFSITYEMTFLSGCYCMLIYK
jgi:hypothetical protein